MSIFKWFAFCMMAIIMMDGNALASQRKRTFQEDGEENQPLLKRQRMDSVNHKLNNRIPTTAALSHNLQNQAPLLYNDLIALIFAILPQKDIWTVSSVCKQWHLASSHNTLPFGPFKKFVGDFAQGLEPIEKNFLELCDQRAWDDFASFQSVLQDIRYVHNRLGNAEFSNRIKEFLFKSFKSDPGFYLHRLNCVKPVRDKKALQKAYFEEDPNFEKLLDDVRPKVQKEILQKSYFEIQKLNKREGLNKRERLNKREGGYEKWEKDQANSLKTDLFKIMVLRAKTLQREQDIVEWLGNLNFIKLLPVQTKAGKSKKQKGNKNVKLSPPLNLPFIIDIDGDYATSLMSSKLKETLSNYSAYSSAFTPGLYVSVITEFLERQTTLPANPCGLPLELLNTVKNWCKDKNNVSSPLLLTFLGLETSCPYKKTASPALKLSLAMDIEYFFLQAAKRYKEAGVPPTLSTGILAHVYTVAGQACMKTHNWDLAKELYQNLDALKIKDNKFASSFANAGYACMMTQDCNGAKYFYHKALEMNPDLSDLPIQHRVTASIACLKTQDWDGAKYFFHKALEMNPDLPASEYVNAGYALAKTAENKQGEDQLQEQRSAAQHFQHYIDQVETNKKSQFLPDTLDIMEKIFTKTHAAPQYLAWVDQKKKEIEETKNSGPTF